MSVVLIYRIKDYPENGGGISYVVCRDEQDAIKIINELNNINGEKFQVDFIGNVSSEIKIEAVDRVTEYRIK